MDFTCCWKAQPCPTPPPTHCTHKPSSRLAKPSPGSREQSCPTAPSVSASIHVGPRRLHLLRRTVRLMSCWKEMFGLPHHLCQSLLGCWAHVGVSMCTTSQASSVSIGNQSLGVSCSQQGPRAFSSDINSSVAETQKTIKILMCSREDSK